MSTQEDELREKLTERGIEYAESQDRFRARFRFNYCEACGDYLDEIEVMGACITASKSYLTPEQAIAATLGGQIDADLRKAIDFMRIWISEDAHLGESEFSYELEKAEGLRKLEAIEQAIAATLGSETCRNEWAQFGKFRCSECWTQVDAISTNTTRPISIRYCPSCGRKVVGA